MKKYYFLFFLLIFSVLSFAQAGSLDTTFNPGGTGANSRVNEVHILNDGKILIVGQFTSYNGTTANRIARLNSDGSLDTSFNVGGVGLNQTATSINVQPDGKILVGGFFGSYNNTFTGRLTRLNANGSLDTTFTPSFGPDNTVNDIAIQPDGKIVIGGEFTNYDGVLRRRIARVNPDGTLDTTFVPSGTTANSGANQTVFSIAYRTDTRMWISGGFTVYGGLSRGYIARLFPNGGLDPANLPAGANNGISTLVMQPDEKILVGGSFSTYSNVARNRIARVNIDGTLDTTFNPGTGANNTVISLTVLPDGKIIVAGIFTTYNGITANRIARLNADGTLDTAFNVGTGPNNFGIDESAFQPDGKVVIVGNFTSYNGINTNYIARINGDIVQPTVPTLSSSSTSNCGSVATTLSIATGTLNNATNWQWYSDSCGGVAVGSGTSISVTPAVTTTYFARGEGGGTTPGSCGSVTITVNPVTGVGSNVVALCAGDSYTWPVNGVTYSTPQSGITVVDQCNTATLTVTVQALPNAGISGTLSLPIGTIPTDAQLFAALTGTPDAGGAWTNVGLVYNYTIEATLPCRVASTATVTLLESIPTSLFFCQGAKVSAAVGTTSLKFYLAATGGFALSGTTTLTTRTLFATQTVNGIESTPRVAVAITVNPLPATPATITGTVAQGALVGTTTTATYTIADVLNATSYAWTAPNGVNIISGQGTNTVTVNFANVPAGVGAIGNLSVVAVNSNNCNSLVRNLALTKALPTAPSGIKMYDDAFPTFSASTGAQIAIASFAKYMGTDRVLRLTATPALTATSYIWELPEGVNQLSGGTSNVITVNFLGVTSANTFNYVTASGVSTNVVRIGVKASNGVGVSTTNTAALLNPSTSSTARQLTLTAVRPAAVTAVTGQIAGLCGGTTYTYSIRDTALASSYTVTAPAGAVVNFTSTLTFTVTYPIGFVVNISTTPANKTLVIRSVNGIGTSATARTLTLSTTMPALGVATPTSYTRATPVLITIAPLAGAVSYNWTGLPAGASIINGQGTNAVLIDFSGVAIGTSFIKLTVTATNACGISTAVKAVNLSNTAPGTRVRQIIAVTATEVYPNPTSNSFSIDISASSAGTLEMTIYSLNGVIIASHRAVALLEGNNTISEDISLLARGVYLVHLTNSSSNEVIIKKLIKE